MSSHFASLESLESRRLLSASPLVDAGGDGGGVAVPIFVTAPKPTNGGVTLNEFARQKFTAKLGTFHLKVSDLTLNAVVHWGDGTKSDGTIEGSYATGDWYVEGSHKYAHTGTYQVDVGIFTHPIGSPIIPSSPTVSFDSVITARTLAPTNGGIKLTEVVGQSFNTEIGEFTFKTIDQSLTAEITWGDGTHSDGKLVGSYATGKYYVIGKHTYAKTGTYAVNVQIFAKVIGSPVKPTSPVKQFLSVIKVEGAA
jgi:hypothetical protein